jgi:Tfp pilus assembly protein PilV
VRPGARSGPRGLTLIEFLFAVSITAFVGLGVASMFPAALRSVMSGGNVSKATALAREMAEMIRTEPFDTLLTIPNAGNNWTGYNGFDTRNLSVTCPVSAPQAGTTAYDAAYLKKKWECDMEPDGTLATGKGVPAGYGTVIISCLNLDGSVNSTSPCPTDVRRVTVTITWDRDGARSITLTTNVVRTP